MGQKTKEIIQKSSDYIYPCILSSISFWIYLILFSLLIFRFEIYILILTKEETEKTKRICFSKYNSINN